MSVVDDVRWILAELRGLGETVVEIPWWETNGDGPMPGVDGMVNHYDAIDSFANAAGLRVVTFGRAAAPGVPPLRNSLSMWYVDLKGTIYVVAAGVSWHAGSGSIANNTRWAGVEIQNRNLGEPMPQVQHRAVLHLNRVCRARWGYPLRNVIDHKEHTSRKSDRRGVDPSAWRDMVGAVPAPATILEEDDVPAPDHITGRLPTPTGDGAWLLQYDGGIWTEGDAPYLGSYPGLPEADRQGTRGFWVIAPHEGGYMLVATDRSTYHFPAGS